MWISVLMLPVICEGKRIWGMIQFDEGLPNKTKMHMEKVHGQWKNGYIYIYIYIYVCMYIYKYIYIYIYIVVLEYIRVDIIMTVICCYVERGNFKVLKFDINNFSYFEISTSLF